MKVYAPFALQRRRKHVLFTTLFFQILVYLCSFVCAPISSKPHFYNPFYDAWERNIPHFPSFASYRDNSEYISPYLSNIFADGTLASYLALPDVLPPLNVLAEVPYAVRNQLTVVPMFVVSRENMKTINGGEIATVSPDKPEMMLKTDNGGVLSCTPVVKIILDVPIVVYSLKMNVMFPAEMEIVHQGFRIPVQVGAVIAPVAQGTFVSTETPVAVDVVYAIPAQPVRLDYVNNENGVIINADDEAVVVEEEKVLPPKNVTVINFPDKEAEPVLQVDEEDDELGKLLL